MREAMVNMMQSRMPATAPARAHAMVQMMSAKLDSMKTIVGTEQALYAVLTDSQKATADALLSGPTMGMGPMMGMGGRGM
jgi:hypothetical protein